MAIIIIDGFEFFEGSYKDKDPYKNPIFNLTEPEIEKKLNYIIEKEIKKISIGTNYNDLDFLTRLNFVEYVSIENNIFIQKLYFLKNLKNLYLNSNNKRVELDYSNFRMLEILSTDWYNGFPDLSKNIFLKELIIWKYKPKCKSFKCLSLPSSLEVFQITETNIENLEGLKNTKTNQLEVYYSSKLISLVGLKEIKESLKILIIENAKNLRDFEDLWECENIEKIILTNCGKIPSLRNLTKLKKLKMFTFYNTSVEDGELSNLFNVDYVYFKNQKHYNHKCKEFEDRK